MVESIEKSRHGARPNYLYSIFSVTLVLFLLGFFGLVLLHAQRLVIVFREKVNILVELQEGASSSQIAQIQRAIEESYFVKPGTIQFTSKEDAARTMQEEFGEDFLKLDLPNPFYDLISFNVKANFMDTDSLNTIRNRLRENDAVNDVFYQDNLINDIVDNIQSIGFMALIVGLLFIFIAIALIHNTIRLALYSNRFLIKNMELVGASWRFISRPYLIRSILHGLVSGLLAIIGLMLLLIWAQTDLPELKAFQDPISFAILFLVLLFLGISIYSLSTYYVVNKYLRMRVDDLY